MIAFIDYKNDVLTKYQDCRIKAMFKFTNDLLINVNYLLRPYITQCRIFPIIHVTIVTMYLWFSVIRSTVIEVERHETSRKRKAINKDNQFNRFYMRYINGQQTPRQFFNSSYHLFTKNIFNINNASE